VGQGLAKVEKDQARSTHHGHIQFLVWGMCIGRKTFRKALWYKTFNMDIRNGRKKGKQTGEMDKAK
jgi:hypothetical protein